MRTLVALATSMVLLACSSGSGGSEAAPADSSPAQAYEEPEPAAVDEIGAVDPGTARVVLGSVLDATLQVTSCELDPGAEPQGEIPAERLVLRAEGQGSDGAPILLEVLRLASQGASSTITDTVLVTEGPEDAPTRILEAQRFEVGGLVTDPRDPVADEPLLRVTGQEVAAAGVFAPPGAFAVDGGLVEGLVAASCAG